MNELIGDSLWAYGMRRLIAKVAPTNCNVLITGSTGTGKEVIARAIHAQSNRRDGPWIPVNCSSVSASLFASQLFGHVKGAFTGATGDAPGSFRAAEGGTIFLDEIGELPLELQPQLLRAIEERTVTPVGEHNEIRVDVRVLAATNRDLRQEAAAGRFRADLYHRLDVVELTTLPLSRRPEDIAPLCDFFLPHLCAKESAPVTRLSPEAVRVLQAHDWQGNVRELRNVLERAAIFSNDAVISAGEVAAAVGRNGGPAIAGRTGVFDEPSLPMHACGNCGSDAPPRGMSPRSSCPTLAESESRLIREALEEAFYNRSAAAQLLDIDRHLLLRKMRKYCISVPRRLGRAA